VTSHLTMAEAAATLRDVNAAAVWRWCRYGIRSRSGEQLYLRHIRVGVRLYTTQSWLEQFSAEVAEADMAHFRKGPRPPRRRRPIADQSDIEKQLEAAGL
jgi:hypothetical protein